MKEFGHTYLACNFFQMEEYDSDRVLEDATDLCTRMFSSDLERQEYSDSPRDTSRRVLQFGNLAKPN